jgi:hypothetical protein
VIGCIEGNLDLRGVVDFAKEVVNVTSSNNCKRFLNDVRKAQLRLSTFDLYGTCRTLDEMGLNRQTRRALVINELTEDWRFFETASINYGHIVKVFDDYDEAVRWLGLSR